MPLIVRQELKRGPGTYGLLLACIGIGAITGAILMPRLIRRVTRDTIIRCASALYGIAMLALAVSDIVAAACAAMLVIGISWMMTASALMTAAQISLPGWVRARGLAFFWIVFTGGMAGGSVVWGQVAGLLNIPAALAIAAACLYVGIAISWRFYVGTQDKADLTPLSPDWAGAGTPQHRNGRRADHGYYRISDPSGRHRSFHRHHDSPERHPATQRSHAMEPFQRHDATGYHDRILHDREHAGHAAPARTHDRLRP